MWLGSFFQNRELVELFVKTYHQHQMARGSHQHDNDDNNKKREEGEAADGGGPSSSQEGEEEKGGQD